MESDVTSQQKLSIESGSVSKGDQLNTQPHEKATSNKAGFTTTTKVESLDTDDATTKVSDRQVYIKYFKAMGLWNAFVFLLIVLAFAVCLKLPGTSSALNCRPHQG
jgi:hypothetical protein